MGQPKGFTAMYNLICELYAPKVIEGEIITAYEPLPTHKDFIKNNKVRIIEKLKNGRYLYG